jgi:long-chain acyl-CoA synthetase
MKAYYKDEEATSETIKDGWLYSGDLGYLDEDGFLYIVGRKKDMIIRGGENIYPAEIERVVAENPKVSEVAVVGVKDKIMGEEAKAYVIPLDPSLTEDELREFLKEKLAEHKIPKYISFMEDLPRNPMGKILKRELREMAAKEHPY